MYVWEFIKNVTQRGLYTILTGEERGEKDT